MRADPLDPDNALLEVHGDDQTIVVALDIEDDAYSG